jgi:hypothetical protein
VILALVTVAVVYVIAYVLITARRATRAVEAHKRIEAEHVDDSESTELPCAKLFVCANAEPTRCLRPAQHEGPCSAYVPCDESERMVGRARGTGES